MDTGNDLAQKYDALTMIDDAHATGFLGKRGRGTHEYRDVMGRVDILTGTLGKALGGASGGYTSGRKEIVELLRQPPHEPLLDGALVRLVHEQAVQREPLDRERPLIRLGRLRAKLAL